MSTPTQADVDETVAAARELRELVSEEDMPLVLLALLHLADQLEALNGDSEN